MPDPDGSVARSTDSESQASTGVVLDRGVRTRARVYELGQPVHPGIPRGPVHPPFMYSLTAKHGDGSGFPGMDPAIACAADAFSMGTHTGTHMDGLAHCSYNGVLFDGTDVSELDSQDDARGIRTNGRAAIPTIVAPGVLLDFASLLCVEKVPAEYTITASEIERAERSHGVRIQPGDVVLFRTGWDRLWADAASFLRGPFPGPDGEAAKWLSARGVLATGSDTMPYEQAPSVRPLEVHAELLAKAGVFIFECLNLVGLAENRAYEFQFVSAPLRLIGATGSPVNPVAILT